MVKIILPERDFDYELQALVASFFPGQHVQAEVCGEEPGIIDSKNCLPQLI